MLFKQAGRRYLIGALVVLLNGCAVYTEHSDINFFADIAFGGQRPADAPANGIIKWTKPIRYSLEGATPQQRDLFVQITEQYMAISPAIRYEAVSHADEADLRVYFVKHQQLHSYGNGAEQTVNANGYCQFSRLNNYRIEQATVHVAGDTPAAEQKIALEEKLGQCLGLTAPAWDRFYYSSVFYRHDHIDKYITPLDKWAIRTLYRADISPGMSKSQVADTLGQGKQTEIEQARAIWREAQAQSANDKLTTAMFHFPAGTSLDDVAYWLEETYRVNFVSDVLYYQSL